MTHGQVLVLGAASWNRMVHVENLPQGQSATIFDAKQTMAAGSTGVGKSMALAAMGCAPVLHCSLGQDDFALQVIAECEKRGIRMLVDRTDAQTAHHLNLMDSKGGRFSIFLSNGDPDPDIDEARVAQAIHAATTVFLSLSASSKKILHLLADSDAEVLLDLHDYDGSNPWYDDFIALADVIQLSDVALNEVSPVVERLLRGRAHQVILTKGEMGAEIFTRHQQETIPICPAQMVDSNGAGDTFSVAFWLAQRNGKSLSDAGKFAATAAAFAIEDASLFPRDVSYQQILDRAGCW